MTRFRILALIGLSLVLFAEVWLFAAKHFRGEAAPSKFRSLAELNQPLPERPVLDPASGQIDIPWLAEMPRLPEALAVRDWAAVSRAYYQQVLDPTVKLDGRPLIVVQPIKPPEIRKPVSAQHVTAPDGTRGWRMEYFGNRKLEGLPVTTTVSDTIDFNWGHGKPVPEIERDNFSVRWTGTLVPDVTRDYTFSIHSDDGSRVTVNGEPLFDHLSGAHKASQQLPLVKGRSYEVIVQLVENSGEARIHFAWDHQTPGEMAARARRPTERFKMPSYMKARPDDEIFTCVSAVVGARLSGLDPNEIAGFDAVKSCKLWYSPEVGVYRHRMGNRGPVLHAGIYGYFSSYYGLLLAALYPDEPDFKHYLTTTTEAFLEIAKGMGCPDAPDFNELGFDFKTGLPGGRNEPMNRLGHAPMVAWPLLIGYEQTGNAEMLTCARSIMEWYAAHPGRYEGTHMLGPLTAVRLNAEHGADIDLDRVLAAWFGDGPKKTHGWHVTRGMVLDGISVDGLDGARWGRDDQGFHAFSMGSLLGPSCLAPVVRYDPRYAKGIARYLLHAANAMRLLQGHTLDWEHQDHLEWKQKWDPENLLFYEALMAWEPGPDRKFRPYATGDVIKLGWGGIDRPNPRDYLNQKAAWFSKSSENISLYMGNHVGFLGSIVQRTNVPGLLRWDCVKTDWFHKPAYPTYLYYNPHPEEKSVVLTLEQPADLYDAVSRQFVAAGARDGDRLTLAGDQVRVLVCVPVGANLTHRDRATRADGVVIDYQAGE